MQLQTLDVPRLQRLTIESQSTSFPFASLSKLRSLVSSCQTLPGEMYLMSSLESLTINMLVPTSRSHLDGLNSLQRIKDLKISCYHVRGEETFSEFAQLYGYNDDSGT